MARNQSNNQLAQIKKAIFRRADEFGYMVCGRKESGDFIDRLVEDPEIGGILKDYMKKEKIRTYIKDGILNAYTKAKNKSLLSKLSPEDTVKKLYSCQAEVIQRCGGKNIGVFVLRSADGRIFVVSSGTTLKWETALRKALELLAREPKLKEVSKCQIGLRLSEACQDLTDADKEHIRVALRAIGVKALFCGER